MTETSEQLAEGVEPAGKFRLYLGAAAGVGKTCAMLDEGRRRAERGTDVVVGFVEAHGRPFTLQAVDGLEVVGRKKVTYRNAQFEEMDTKAVIDRHPEVALVDELAHTNVPGSGPHEKRWQDVLDLLEEGISVISTVNVQHMESIADSVERMTGTKVRERLPDWVVRRADQLELIDSSPEQLRRRMAHGNIYPAAKAPAALANFFRTENLTALRELALRFVADEADDDLLARLRGQHVDEVWDVTERILVAVDATPGTDGVMRRAARIAARVKAELHVVHVKSSEGWSSTANGGLDELHRLAEDLDGDWIELVGDNLAKTLMDYAISHQITQIVLGSSRRGRLEELTHGSIVSKVIRLASVSDVDVHVIARRDVLGHPAKARGESRRGGVDEEEVMADDEG
ncbi:MAG: universal stress protein [Acidimicrobiales bacterium]|jgi:two-component system sensor histidine kinase KdpD